MPPTQLRTLLELPTTCRLSFLQALSRPTAFHLNPAIPQSRDLHVSSQRLTMSEFAAYTANGSKKGASNGTVVNGHAWGSGTNPAAFDFRSDVTTTPTASMLAAIQQCTLLDDVFMEDPTTLSLEKFIAELTGKEAALLVLSGTMGNQVALRTHLTAPPQAVLSDRRGHIINYEAGGVASLSQALVQPIDPKNKKYLTLEEVQEYAVVSDDVHACPTRVISLENTLNGTIMPLSEVKRISAWAREHGIIMHMDGARLWEAVAAGAGTLKEFCAEMDSVSLCFSKGLGAPIGSIIIGSEAFIKRSRWVRKSIGGGLRQAGVVAAPARVAVEETFLGGLLAESHRNAKMIEKLWSDLGGKMKYPVDTNMVWLDIEAHNIDLNEWIELSEKYGLRIRGGRLVVHYQIGEEAIQKLEQLFREVLKGQVGNSKKRKAEFDPEDLKLKGKGVE
ncbi:pyridoxal phosphate-dependent transferase [Lophiotrema nucula]|uniref:Pyridoxal phosphate-dependent transferase n=1 Tax=Lophiotrema nucula TaxID=690887 RepID=A0A6A5YQ83_9PLEO|nr:pyridoxal phosphate-dependent transferase [Lophiotrema nucula]